MKFKVYHQLGFRYNWNFASYKGDGAGDGFILAPRSMDKDFVENLTPDLKENSIFDPQFFLPNTAKGNLETYDFFPNIVSEGFETEDYSTEFADESADRCVNFQIENGFEYIVIPTRFMEATPSNYIEQQNSLFVEPFLNRIRGKKTPVFIQIVINDLMLRDEEYKKDILNWLTSFDDINGVYLITQTNSPSKQIKDTDLLISLFDFIDVLRSNEFEIILGYLNTEAVLLTLTDPTIITMGSYENTRSFSIEAFKVFEKTQQRAPNPRLYFSKLLQWIEHPYIGAIKQVEPDIENLFDINKYQAEMFEPSFNWHLHKSQLYKHHFLVFYNQLSQIAAVDGAERYELVKDIISHGLKWFNELEGRGIAFDPNSDGSHLNFWLTVANIFASKKGWR